MKILNEENYYRKLFLQEPNKIEPFALLINVYQNANSFIFQNLDEEEVHMSRFLI